MSIDTVLLACILAVLVVRELPVSVQLDERRFLGGLIQVPERLAKLVFQAGRKVKVHGHTPRLPLPGFEVHGATLRTPPATRVLLHRVIASVGKGAVGLELRP